MTVPTTDDITVGALVGEFLQRCNVETAFGVVSIHNTPMLDALGQGNAIRFVPARGEAGAGSMADAYARVKDGLGVVFTSTGPGAANVTGALVEARFASSPVLHLTGQTARYNVDQARGAVHDVHDQLGMLESVSKAAYRVRSPENALGVLMRAATEAMTPPRGPVSVEIPIDIQRTRIPRPASLDSWSLRPPPMPAPDDMAMQALVEAVRSARRPLLWLGNGARRCGPAVARLMNLGFGVVTSMAGRGVVPETHPQVLGAFNNTPRMEEFYQTVDLMVIAGSRVRGHETRDFGLKLPARRCQIDIDAAANGRTYSCEHFVIAEANAALTALADALEGSYQTEPGYVDELAALKTECIGILKDSLGPYHSFADQLRAVMPENAVWVRDITLNNSTWGNRLLPLNGPNDSVYAIGAGIGIGLAHGIGASLGDSGRKVVAMCGDGGFFLNISELWTAVQENADVVFLVMNDGGYGVIKQIQDTFHDGRHYFADFNNPDLDGLAALAGIPYFRVSEADQLGGAVAKGLAVTGPALVEVDMASVGVFPNWFVPPAEPGRK